MSVFSLTATPFLVRPSGRQFRRKAGLFETSIDSSPDRHTAATIKLLMGLQWERGAPMASVDNLKNTSAEVRKGVLLLAKLAEASEKGDLVRVVAAGVSSSGLILMALGQPLVNASPRLP